MSYELITQESQRASYIDLAVLSACGFLKRFARVTSSNDDGPSSLNSAEYPPTRRPTLCISGLEPIPHAYAAARRGLWRYVTAFDVGCHGTLPSNYGVRGAHNVCPPIFVTSRCTFLQAH